MRVAIAGYAVEGKVSYNYWRQKGDKVVIVDERPMSAYDLPYGAEAMTGKNVFKNLQDFDMVVRTASLRPDRIKTRGVVWSATNEFFANCPAPIIGVTGTKGKGTVSSMIASILRAAGKTVHLVGNIGTPALESLAKIKADDIVVYELSSFQLWDLERSPHVAVVLMVEPDHLDVHKNMAEYIAAKATIRKHQHADDICYYHPTNTYSRDIARSSHAGNAVRFNCEDDGSVYIKDDGFYEGDTRLCGTDVVKLPGAHNLENACAALSVAKAFGISDDACEKGLASFTGLPHRLKFIREVNGVKYYDDSIATTPGSAIAAINSFTEPKILILGGSAKGAKYDEIVKLCAATSTRVVAIGETGQGIAKLCKAYDVEHYRPDESTIQSIVNTIQSIVKPGDVVLLSPASASFDMFKSYVDRGEQFSAAIAAL